MHFENLIIGGDLAAVLFAFANNYPIIFSKIYKPFPFEYFAKDTILPTGLCVKREPREFVNQDFDIEMYYIEKRSLFERLLFSMSMAGQVPFSSLPIENIFYENNSSLRVILKNRASVTTVKYDSLKVFNPEFLTNFPNQVSKAEAKREMKFVIDWGIIKGGGGSRPPYDVLRDSSNRFVEAVYFFPSCRTPKNKSKKQICEWSKDLLTVSRLKNKELDSFECSIGMAARKSVKMMGEYGIKGKWRDKYVLSNHPFLNMRIYYQKPEIKIEARETRTIVKPRLNNFDNVEFFAHTEEELLSNLVVVDSYSRRLNDSFWRTK